MYNWHVGGQPRGERTQNGRKLEWKIRRGRF